MSDFPVTNWRGRGSLPRVRVRRDAILHALHAASGPLTTQEVARAIGAGGFYSTTYADLRQLCGSHDIAYSEQIGVVSVTGYPVCWHTWDTTAPGRTLWSLDPDYRADVDAETAVLEAAWALPNA